MLTRSKAAALQEIRRWTIEDVLAVLEKNGLGDCADVIRKREVVGEMLLQLTEGKLALWKRDINQSKIRTLATFVDDLKMHPEKYLLKENCSYDPEHFPEGSHSPSPVRCNASDSDSVSRAQDTNSKNDKEQKLKVAAAFLSEVISQSATVASSSHDDPLPSYRLKPPDKPPLLTRPKNFQTGATKMATIKMFPPKSPNRSPYETRRFPNRDIVPNNVPTDSTGSDSVSQDHKSEEDKAVKRAASPSARSVSQLEACDNRSHADSLLQVGVQCPSKPVLLRKPNKPNATALYDKVYHTKSQNQLSSKPKHFHARDVHPSHVTSSSSSSGTVLQDAATENKEKVTVQEVPPIASGNVLQSETNGVSSQRDSLPPDELNSSLSCLKETKADQRNSTHEKELLPKPPSRSNLPLRRMPSCSSGSDTASWDTDFEDAESTMEIASVYSKSMSQSEADGDSHMDPGPPGGLTSLEKLPLCSQHSEVQADVISSPSEEMLLPKPPSQSSEIISTVNIGAIEAKIWAEQLDEEFYESLDGENIADVASLRAAVLNHNNEKKSGKKNVYLSSPKQTHKIRAENNDQNGISCTDSVVTTCTKRAFLHPVSDIRENPEAIRPETPPTPPPRNPTMKLNEADAVMNRLHSSSSSLREDTLRQRNHFTQSSEPDSAATSHQSSMTSLNNLNAVSTRTSHLHFSQNSLIFPEPHSDAEYEILDNRSHHTSDTDNILSEVYESIKEQGLTNGVGEDEYYLQPDPRLPSKNDESSSDDSRNLPLPHKSKATLPDVVLPSAPPPSPPRKKSEDSSSSTTSGSGDSMSGRLGGLFRKVISRPQPLLPDYSERATPELKKPCSLPPPTTRPPPPVDQRSSAFQRPLPPTPEGQKFLLPSPDKPHNTIPHQTTRVSFRQMPWFHNVDRHRAEELLRNSEDGCFVVRPSTQTSNPLTLTLWYKNRIFNICIRHRKDGRYALGTEKVNEQSFDSIEEMVTNYQSEKLVLYSAGERAGKVLLTNSPRRNS